MLELMQCVHSPDRERVRTCHETEQHQPDSSIPGQSAAWSLVPSPVRKLSWASNSACERHSEESSINTRVVSPRARLSLSRSSRERVILSSKRVACPGNLTLLIDKMSKALQRIGKNPFISTGTRNGHTSPQKIFWQSRYHFCDIEPIPDHSEHPQGFTDRQIARDNLTLSSYQA